MVTRGKEATVRVAGGQDVTAVEVSVDLPAWFMGTEASRLAVGDRIGYKRNVLDRCTSVVLNPYL
jgi:L-rhamnose isomerase